MSTVKVETIGTNVYAPKDAADINLYAFNGARGLTLAQLVMAVCIRQAALIERGCVTKMNEINASASWLSALSCVGAQVMKRNSLRAVVDLSKTGYVPKRCGMQPWILDFLRMEMEVPTESMPNSENISSFDAKAKVFGLLKNEMNKVTINNQEQMIDLQSYISRRDSTYNTSSATIKKLGMTMNLTASNF